MQILTVLLKSWTVKKIESEFGVTNYIARKVKNLVQLHMASVPVMGLVGQLSALLLELAYKGRMHEEQIMTPRQLFDWACSNIPKDTAPWKSTRENRLLLKDALIELRLFLELANCIHLSPSQRTP